MNGDLRIETRKTGSKKIRVHPRDPRPLGFTRSGRPHGVAAPDAGKAGHELHEFHEWVFASWQSCRRFRGIRRISWLGFFSSRKENSSGLAPARLLLCLERTRSCGIHFAWSDPPTRFGVMS